MTKIGITVITTVMSSTTAPTAVQRWMVMGMANLRRCYNSNCEYNCYGTYCDLDEIEIGDDGCCWDFKQKENKESENERKSD